MRRSACRFFGLLAALALFSIQSARADITWSAAKTISGDTDVQANGTLFAAYGFSSSRSTSVTGSFPEVK